MTDNPKKTKETDAGTPSATQVAAETKVVAVDGEETNVTFDDMGLKPELLRGIYTMGFEKPSVIQAIAIKPCCEGKDVIAQSHSGTGKTATFCISVLQRIDATKPNIQAIIMAPTRELADQIVTVMKEIAQFMNVGIATVVGGGAVIEDEKMLRSGDYQVVIGTPGRIYHMLENGSLDPSDMKLFVLDEADEMLSQGFADQIYKVFTKLPKSKVQVILLSATMPPEAVEMTTRFMRDPVKILIEAEKLSLQGIKQFYILLDEESWKFETLCDIYADINVNQTVIFVNSKPRATRLAADLEQQKFTVCVMHSDMRRLERQKVMAQFRNGAARVLITTDLLSRGIDVQQVSVVINYDLPNNKESYIHRIGRSGRFGRKGVAVNFVTKSDQVQKKAIEDHYATKMEEMPQSIKSFLEV